MSELLKPSLAYSRPLRIAVVGNSNSVMTVSFSRGLARTPNVSVQNWSIGGSPNVVLLNFLAHETDFDYDYIIVETAVVDFLQRGSYTLERATETLELFIGHVRSVSEAQIVFLTIPTRYGLLEPDVHWQEALYQNVAERFGIPILDGFRLVRQLVGLPKMEQIGIFSRRVKKLILSFGLPESLYYSLVWRSLRDSGFEANALGLFGFVDHAHFSAPMHDLVGLLLREFIGRATKHPPRERLLGYEIPPSAVMISEPVGSRYVTRKSSLISRNLLVMASGETTRYRCATGYRAFGLLVNTAGTSGTLYVRSAAGDTKLSLPFGPQPSDWVAVIVPILDTVGDSDIAVTVIPSTGPDGSPSRAELAELILVNSNWRDLVPVIAADEPRSFKIEDAAWAGPLISGAAASAAAVASGIDADTRPIDRECFEYATSLLANSVAPLSNASRAKIMAVMGMTKQLPAFLDAACADQPGEVELERMRSGLQEVVAEAGVLLNELLRRAIDHARKGEIAESDALLSEGMARSMGKIDFFIEYAWNASRRKDWPEAKRRWSRVKDLFPDSRAGYIGCSSAQQELGEFEDAASLLFQATEKFPKEPSVFIEQARLEHRRGARDTAAQLWTVFREKFPGDPAGYIGGALAYHDLGRLADADELIKAGKTLLPTNRDVAFWWADLAARRSDWREAARRWLAVRDVFPEDIRCTLDAARCLAESGDHAQADALIAEAQDSFPDDPNVMVRWADAADQRGNWPVAAQRWKAVRERFPAEKRAYRHEMRAYEALGELDAAEAVARLAVRLFSTHIDILLHAGVIAGRISDLVTASDRFAAAYALDPHNLDAARRYVDVLVRSQRKADAIVVLNEAELHWPQDEVLRSYRTEISRSVA